MRVADEVRHVRVFGSAALQVARVARGQLDFYFKTRYNHWDFAAAALIVQEAGGIVTELNGQPLTSNFFAPCQTRTTNGIASAAGTEWPFTPVGSRSLAASGMSSRHARSSKLLWN
jgi:fructose-1,6-bisphosphatase/inositol monophosphatase family enzyme